VKHVLLLVVYFLCVLFGFSQNETSINFEIKNAGIRVDGLFESTSVKIQFDASGHVTQIEGIIKVASIKTGIHIRDTHLLKADYFDAEHFKNITLISKSITFQPDSTYQVTAILTIKGIAKKVNMLIKQVKIDNSYKLTSSFNINRKDFNVGGGNFFMSNTVQIYVVHIHKL